jgi:uncharacterized membrane protein YfcA
MASLRHGLLRLLLVLLALVSISHTAAESSVGLAEDATDAGAVKTAYRCDAALDCMDANLHGHVCRDHVCVPDKLFPLSRTEIYGSIAAFISNILAAGSGLGGGGLLVPAYILTMGLSSHEAIPLSKATIFGSSIASFLINVRKRHPLARDRPLIDYETVLLLEPMTLAGTIIGVNMNKVFPEWLITVCIVWLLTKTSLRTYAKGISIWKQERAADNKMLADIVNYWKLLPSQSNFKQFQAVARAYLKWKAYKRPTASLTSSAKVLGKTLEMPNPQDDDRSSLASTVLSINDLDDDLDLSDNASEEETLMNAGVQKSHLLIDHMPTLDELKAYRSRVPYGDLVVLFMTWIGLVLFSLAKGGHGSPSIIGLACGSLGYWLLVALSFPFFAFATLYYGIKIARAHRFLQASGYEYLKGDMVWDRAAVIRYPALCTAAGLAAGLLGIGGGMVKGPLLLEMGLLPQVASATSSSMILFTSSATTIQFIVLGTLSVDHALWHGFIGFVAGVIGQYGVSYLIKKYRTAAFVIFLIAGVVGFSGMIMGVLGAQKIAVTGLGGFRSLCHAPHA